MKQSLFRVRKYISYRLSCVGAHGLHSPFLYRLYQEVIRPARTFRLPNVEQLRNDLKKSRHSVDLYDLKEQRHYRRPVSEIAKTSLSNRKFSAFLNLLIGYLKVENAIETGTSLGINSLYMAGNDHLKKLSTIEASPALSAIAKKQLGKVFQNKVEVTTGTIQDVFESVVIQNQPDLCFIDADHRSEAVRMCVDSLLKHVPKIKCIVIHDIYWSEDMYHGWQELAANSRFPLTVDLFQAGLIFPNLEMPKQHFKVRF